MFICYRHRSIKGRRRNWAKRRKEKRRQVTPLKYLNDHNKGQPQTFQTRDLFLFAVEIGHLKTVLALIMELSRLWLAHNLHISKWGLYYHT